MASLQLAGLGKRYPNGTQVVQSVDLTVQAGEFMVLVGPSGCGKSTTLRMVAGLEDVSEGRILIGGRDVTQVAPAQRGVAMVFQSYALYPHMTVAENMGFGLKMAGVPKAEVAAKVRRAAETLQLGALLQRKPRELSGGQRQRVAIGRAIVREPQVFLFDEPLSNLDAALRTHMRLELSRLHERLGSTIVYVTHDQVEAMTLGDRIAVFNAGRIEQVGTPMDLYQRPANRFVAGFLGSPRTNFLQARAAAVDGGVRIDLGLGGGWVVPAAHWPQGAALADVACVGARPEHLGMGPNDREGLVAEVELVEALGDVTLLHCRAAGQPETITVKRHAEPDARLVRGDVVRLTCAPRHLLLFDREGRALL